MTPPPEADKETLLSIKINSFSKMKGEDGDLCICGRTLIVGDGTVFSPGFVTISPKTGLIKAVTSGAPPDQGNLYVFEMMYMEIKTFTTKLNANVATRLLNL